VFILMAILGFLLLPDACQLAWHHNDEIKEKVLSLHSGQTHAGILLSQIKEFLPMSPEIIVTTTGPGSFTSIRVQLAAAIGLKIGYRAKLFCPNTLDLLEWASNGSIPVLDSFRGDYFTKLDGVVRCITTKEIDTLKREHKSFCGDLGWTPENLAIYLLKYYLSYKDPDILNKPEPYYVRTPEYKTRTYNRK
jgi:tRNA A37 threonylcarbamoyladenosine modification protein TsaB